jgi:hypothetical protein
MRAHILFCDDKNIGGEDADKDMVLVQMRELGMGTIVFLDDTLFDGIY